MPQGHFEDWRSALGSGTELAAFREASLVIGPSGSEVRVEGAVATDNLFSLLGVAPLLGRSLQPNDVRPGSEPVVARLPDNANAESFGAELAAIARRLEEAYPEDRGWSPRVARFGDTSLSDSRTALLLAMGAAWLVLLVVAYLAARTLQSLLFDVEPLDLSLFVAAAALLVTVALTASLAPAIRAARFDPRRLLKG